MVLTITIARAAAAGKRQEQEALMTLIDYGSVTQRFMILVNGGGGSSSSAYRGLYTVQVCASVSKRLTPVYITNSPRCTALSV